MYSESSRSFSGNNTVHLFTQALMEGTIITDTPSLCRGVFAGSELAGNSHRSRKDDMLEFSIFSTDTGCMEILEDDESRRTTCTCDLNSGKLHRNENESVKTGSRTKELFRFCGHFRSFEWRLVLFSFMLLIHGIG